MKTFVYCLVLTFGLSATLTVLLTGIVKSGRGSFPDKHTLNPLENQTSERNLRPHRHRRFIILARSSDNDTECSSSEEDFPKFLDDDDVKHGGVVLVILVGIYCFTLLAIVCDNYFLPCMEKICETLHLTPDVAAATFMSVATSTPELFTNIIGTFITESDMGIGTIVGSSLFNVLGVASVGSLAASAPIQMDWWPVTRDVIIYICSVLLLIEITWDGTIYWYEGLILFIVYFIYFTIMFQNVRISNFVKKMINRNHKVEDVGDCEKAEKAPSTVTVPGRGSLAVVSAYGSYAEEQAIAKGRASIALARRSSAALARRSSAARVSAINTFVDDHGVAKYTEEKIINDEPSEEEESQSLFRLPKGSLFKKFWFFYTWPIKFALQHTVPDPMKHPKLFPLTFVLCIVWIGTNAYVVSWMISIIGNMFNIPDAVLGLTFLAAGSSLPEAMSITIMSRRGEGSMGVSNSLGANTMNILLSLGMPWFLKTITMGANDSSRIIIESGSIEYTIAALVVIACILYLTLFFNKFQLRRRVGCILICIYSVVIVLAILSEMVFFEQDACVEE